jgi:hypothetical protein
MVWPILISVSVTPGALSARAEAPHANDATLAALARRKARRDTMAASILLLLERKQVEYYLVDPFTATQTNPKVHSDIVTRVTAPDVRAIGGRFVRSHRRPWREPTKGTYWQAYADTKPPRRAELNNGRRSASYAMQALRREVGIGTEQVALAKRE